MYDFILVGAGLFNAVFAYEATIKKLWDTEPETLDRASRNTFRDYTTKP